MKAEQRDHIRKLYLLVNYSYYIIHVFIRIADKNTSIAFGVLGCLLSGAMMTFTSPAQEEETSPKKLPISFKRKVEGLKAESRG